MKKKFTVISGRLFTDKNGREMVVLNGANGETAFLSRKQLKSAGYIHPIAVIGNEVEVEFYKEGDEMFNKEKCTKDGVIAKDTHIFASDEDRKIAKAVGFGMSLEQINKQVSAE